jgi:hypothetical protein
MPTEPDYREMLQRAQQCTDDVKEFLVAVCNSPQGKTNEAILSAAALTVEQLRIVEGQISGIWDLFQQSGSPTLDPAPLEHAPPTLPDDGSEEKPVPQSWPE